MKKKIFITIALLILGYYIIGFPLTLSGVTKEWPLFPGGPTLKYEGAGSSVYDTDILLNDTDGPYLFYRGDSLEIVRITADDTTSTPVFESIHKRDKSQIQVECNFKNNPEWNFKTRLKDTLENEQTTYTGVKQMLVISDIEGNFKAFRELLIARGVIDSLYHWTFSDGHLILLGDFFDRGLNVTECLWLIYHLENEAKLKGGYVHYILGNHELMNMSDDFRYVRKKYIKSASLTGRAYHDLYKPDSELGKWLATKNIVEKVNDIIFVHGGISKSVLETGITLEEINQLSRPYYFTPSQDLPTTNPDLKILFDTDDSPFWNRDYVNEAIDERFIDQVLGSFNANKIVIGHTVVDRVKTFYSGKVIAVDTPHTDDNSQGLVMEAGEYFSIDRRGKKGLIK